MNDVANIADKRKEQLQQLVMVNVCAVNVGGGWIVMVCLHEYHPLFPRAVTAKKLVRLGLKTAAVLRLL